MNAELLKYLVDNCATFMGVPISGDLSIIHVLFALASNQEFNDIGSQNASFVQFWRDLKYIADLCPGSMSFQPNAVDSGAVSQQDAKIEHIDTDALKAIRSRVLEGSFKTVPFPETPSSEPRQKLTLSERMLTVLESGSAATPNRKALTKLEQILAVKPSCYRLGRERAQKLTPHKSFISVCANRNHSSVLSTIVTISGNKLVLLDWAQLANADQNCPGLSKCAQTKIHHIPNLKPQTDKSLGDCSYLDTCHKLNSCRYVHYLQYVPDSLVQTVQARSRELNNAASNNSSICFYTKGLCCSVASRPTLPAQWIRCDVRKFDFSILGQFSVVVADPAWNIRMNLPYGTCNDSELTDLPLNLLQQEGILFLWVTGRAIEVGKESLRKWGYQVCNEISWVKTNQLGRTIVTGRTGHWLNHSKEHLLVGIKGNSSWLNRQSDIDVIVSASRETSRKPDELYGMIERLVGPHARKLEIFGRDHNTRPGWFTIGNQLSGDCVLEPDVQQKYHRYLNERATIPKLTVC